MFDIQQIDYLLEEKFETLSEAQIEFLIENRIEFIKNANRDKISTEHDPESAKFSSDKIVDTIAKNFDPTSNKSSTQWLVNRYKAGDFKLKDAKKVKQTLEKYEQVKPFMENKDLNAMKSLTHLRDNIAPTTIRAEHKEKEDAENVVENMPLLYDEKGVRGYSLPNKKTSIENFTETRGKLAKTKWCTAWDNRRNMFDGYSGGKYPMQLANGEWLQLHHASGQLQDVNNSSADIKKDPRFKDYQEGIVGFIKKSHEIEGTNTPSRLADTHVGIDSEKISKLLDEHNEAIQAHADFVAQGGTDHFTRRNLINKVGSANSNLDRALKNANVNDEVFERLKNSRFAVVSMWKDGHFTEQDDKTLHLAKSPHVKPEHLDKIADTLLQKDWSNHVSDTVAELSKNPNISPETHHKVLGTMLSDKLDENAKIRNIAYFAENAVNAQPEHFERLENHPLFNSDRFDQSVLSNKQSTIPLSFLERNKERNSRLVASRKEITPEIANHILSTANPDSDSVINLAVNNSVPSEIANAAVNKIASSPSNGANFSSEKIKQYINKENIEPQHISNLVNHVAEGRIRSSGFGEWMNSHRLSRADIQTLAKSPYTLAMMNRAGNIANNPKIRSDDLELLMNNEKFDAKKDIHASHITGSDALKSKNIDTLLQKGAHSHVAQFIFNDPHNEAITHDHLHKLLDSDSVDHHSKMKILSHPKAQLSHFDKVSKDIRFAGAISNSKNAPPSTLHSLATSPLDHVRRNVAENPNTEARTYEILKTDANADIRAIAEKKGAKK